MFHLFHYKNLFLGFNSIHAIRIQSLPNPFRKCHHQTDPPSSLIEYLQSSLGFPQERALKVFQRLKCKNPKNPDAVVTFFKSHGLSETHIKSIIDRVPELLSYFNPESSLRPKIQFLKDKGISHSDLADLMVSNPSFFAHSLERHIKPVLDVLRSILGTDEIAVKLLIRTKIIFRPDVLSTNLSILRNCGVQNHHISKLFIYRLRELTVKSDRFNEVVEMVKGMGFRPKSSLFIHAVFTILGLSRRTWDAKFKVYRSLGWSDEEILSLFRKQPACMSLSEEKIRKGVAYLTKELGWGPSYILIYPCLLTYSLERRIIPRHGFLQFLASKGFIKEDKIFVSSFIMGKQQFLKNFVMEYESEVPDILKIYEGLIRSKFLNI